MTAAATSPHLDAASRPADLARQIAIICATCFMIVAAAVGTGALGGTPVQDLQGGALDTDGSYLAPAGPAFSIWSAIYLLLIAYTVWQALPGQRGDRRQRAIGWWVALTALLNGLWLLAAQFATLPVTVVVILLLAAALGVTFQRTVAVPAEGIADRIFIDGTTGLHLGWVTLASVANTAAWLTASDLDVALPDVWGVVVLAVVAAIGVAIAVAGRGRFAPGLAIAWGLGWLGVGRLTGEPASTPIGIAAIAVAVIVLVVPVAMGVRRASRGSRWFRP
ncbi:tryptophan-rich sensory protein [Microbacterium sp. SS28]|uniref:tryptophan-rich sensory protein n=1 Tax=Microbacterium sp. SS28 TaxID=2919948 RepID=UPI001FA95128|nr:tryptophan-rich sensory protein [Microbacterium sp. SS28]